MNELSTSDKHDKSKEHKSVSDESSQSGSENTDLSDLDLKPPSQRDESEEASRWKQAHFGFFGKEIP